MSYICYKKGVTSVTGVTNSYKISFRRPKGGRRVDERSEKSR